MNREIFGSEKSLNKNLLMITKPKKYPLKYPITFANKKDDNLFICNKGFLNQDHWKVIDLISTIICHCLYIGTSNNIKSSKNDFNFTFYTNPDILNKHNNKFLNKYTDKEIRDKNINIINLVNNKPISSSMMMFKYININFNNSLPNRKNLNKIKENIFNISQIKSINTLLKKSLGNKINEKYLINSSLPLPFKLNLNLKDFKKCSSLLKKFSLEKIKKLLNEISEFKISTNYEIIVYNYKYNNYISYKIPLTTELSNLFNIEKSDDKNNYILNFNTTLGYFFTNNLLACNFHFFDNTFYEYNLSPNSEFLYRYKILNKYNSSKINLNVDELIKLFRFTSYSLNYSIKKINDILEELKNNKLIDDFQFIDKKNFEYFILNLNNKNIIPIDSFFNNENKTISNQKF